jgi:hypothetical protein
MQEQYISYAITDRLQNSSIITSEDDVLINLSAHFLGKMVNEAPVNRKEAQFHSYLTFSCGLNMKIKWVEGNACRRRPHNLSLDS